MPEIIDLYAKWQQSIKQYLALSLIERCQKLRGLLDRFLVEKLKSNDSENARYFTIQILLEDITKKTNNNCI
jgi:hypothetical protein